MSVQSRRTAVPLTELVGFEDTERPFLLTPKVGMNHEFPSSHDPAHAHERRRIRVVVTGDLDRSRVPRFHEVMATCLPLADVVEIDLGLVEFIDSDGLMSLIDSWIARADGQRVVVCEASAVVRRLLERTGTAEVLGLTATERPGPTTHR